MSITINTLTYNDYSLCNESFINGIEFLNRNMLPLARQSFEIAYEKTHYSDTYHNKYASFCGYLRVLCGERSGLDLCRNVAQNEINDADVFLNLARSEWFFHDRKRTIFTILKGLEVDRTHRALREFYKKIDQRKRKLIFFLSRDSFINTFIGKLLRK